MNQTSPAIDPARLRALLDGVNAYGRNPATGGFNRIGFSDADMAARRWFAGEMARDGLAVQTDPAGNVFGRWGAADEPCLMVGSHLDTVPEGGAFDGALGVSVALECVRAMRGAGLSPAVPIEVAAFAEEEGRFGGMLGSQAVTGQVTVEWLDAAADAESVRLADAMRAQGLDPREVPLAARPRGSVRAFLELHIEQGPVLEAAGVPIGLAHSVSGVCHLAVRLEGRANHSGTTPMALRADAFAGLAEIACAVPGIIAGHGTPESRITVGRVALEPNFPHTVPGAAEFSVILRDTDEDVMRALERALREAIARTATRGLRASIAEMSWLSPVALGPGLLDVMKGEAAALGLACLDLASGAGHDAQTMHSLCPSALVFVSSRNGVSHAPEEWTDWADIEKGAALMLAAIGRLSGAKAPHASGFMPG
jgi:hydantoinase/carbamoylase family amidase